jgi:hypothetical protein
VGQRTAQACAKRHGRTLDQKNGESIYEYKNHVNVDRDTQLITAWKDTPAQVHDSQALEAVFRCP